MDSSQAATLIFQLSGNLMRFFANNFIPAFKVNATGSRSISERQYHILFLIEYSGADTLSSLADVMCLSPSGLSTVVTKMTVNGLLTKNHFSAGRDGRTVVFEITPVGRAALNDLTNEMLTNIKSFHSRLSNHNLADLLAGYDMISRALLGKPIEPDLDSSAQKFADSIFGSFIEVKHLINARYVKCFARGGRQGPALTSEQFHMLCIIRDFGVHSLSDMSRVTGLSGSAISIAIKNLTKVGYIRKEKPEDGRRMEFYITVHGVEVLAQVQSTFLKEFEQIYETFENPQLFCEGLEKLNSLFSGESYRSSINLSSIEAEK